MSVFKNSVVFATPLDQLRASNNQQQPHPWCYKKVENTSHVFKKVFLDESMTSCARSYWL